jgi:hypothetical protein
MIPNLLQLAFVDLLILLILKFCVLIAMVVVVLGLSFLDSVQVPHLVPMRHAIVLSKLALLLSHSGVRLLEMISAEATTRTCEFSTPDRTTTSAATNRYSHQYQTVLKTK